VTCSKPGGRVRSSGRVCSSSSDSDDSLSSSEENSPTNLDEEIGKSLKRKLDDSSCDSCLISNRSNTSTNNCGDWYSSPKMACLVHGSSQQQNQNQNVAGGLSGLISVLQSAALTNDVEPKSTNQNNSNRIFDNESNDTTSSSRQRNLSCSGLLELTCES